MTAAHGERCVYSAACVAVSRLAARDGAGPCIYVVYYFYTTRDPIYVLRVAEKVLSALCIDHSVSESRLNQPEYVALYAERIHRHPEPVAPAGPGRAPPDPAPRRRRTSSVSVVGE